MCSEALNLFETDMSKYTEFNPTPATRKYIDIINGVLAGYSQRLTLRQLYYQLVSRNIIPNSDKEYKKLSAITTKARKEYLINWRDIEDRLRKPKLPYSVFGIEDALSDTVRHYRLNRMKGQERHIEVWVEKDSLSGVLSPVCSKYHIRLMVNRGYSSITAMFEAEARMGQDKTLLYFISVIMTPAASI